MENIVEIIKEKHFNASFAMLEEIVDLCPEDIWVKTGDDHPLWQYIFHALAGIWVWFRPQGSAFQEPPLGKEIAEMEIVPEKELSREEIKEFTKEAQARADAFFSLIIEEDTLLAPYSFYEKISNLDVIMMQIRHIQHHVGYCNRILSLEGATTAFWQG